MKKYIRYFFLIVTVSSLLVACQPDEEDEPDITGDVRANISGTWRSQENSATYGQSNYYVDISVDSTSSNGIKIDNFFNMGQNKEMKATVSGNTITLSSAPFEGFVFSGTGNISSTYKTITWSYTFFDGNETEPVSGTYTKL